MTLDKKEKKLDKQNRLIVKLVYQKRSKN